MAEVLAGVPLAPLTTLRLGGPAERLMRVSAEAELVEAARALDAEQAPVVVLAGGSNVVVADAGVAGTVLQVATRGVQRRELADGRVALTVQAGEDWDAVVAGAVEDDLAGIECLSGIPGSTGATPIQNVGAYGQEVATTIVAVRALDRQSGDVLDLSPEDCGFAYRTSRFRRRDSHLVLSVTFALAPAARSGSEPIRYPELARALDLEVGDRAPLPEVRAAVLALRRGKGMVLDPADPDSVSAGSFFTNPILDADRAAALERRVRQRLGPDASLPQWPEASGRVKTSAAWLVERAGFCRGYGEGPVGVSSRHTLALINRGGARTVELVALAREIAAGVQAAFGIALTPEPVFVGHSW